MPIARDGWQAALCGACYRTIVGDQRVARLPSHGSAASPAVFHGGVLYRPLTGRLTRRRNTRMLTGSLLPWAQSPSFLVTSLGRMLAHRGPLRRRVASSRPPGTSSRPAVACWFSIGSGALSLRCPLPRPQTAPAHPGTGRLAGGPARLSPGSAQRSAGDTRLCLSPLVRPLRPALSGSGRPWSALGERLITQSPS